MSLVFSYTDNNNTQVAVYKLPDALDDLRLFEINTRFRHFRSQQKRLEKYGVERLMHSLNLKGEIHYDNFGKPYLPGGPNISITHTKDFVGIAFNSNHKIGIDLEYPSKRVMNVLSRFLDDKELSMCDVKNYETPLIMWCAKEATFKAYGNKKVSLLNHIKITEVKNLDNFTASINFKNDKKTYNLRAIIKPEFYLAVSIEASPQ